MRDLRFQHAGRERLQVGWRDVETTCHVSFSGRAPVELGVVVNEGQDLSLPRRIWRLHGVRRSVASEIERNGVGRFPLVLRHEVNVPLRRSLIQMAHKGCDLVPRFALCHQDRDE